MNLSEIIKPGYEIMNCSKELKKQIRKRVDELDVSVYQLSKQIKVEYKKLRNYFNTGLPANEHVKLKQKDLFKLMDSLGIEARLTIIIKPISTAYAKPFEKIDDSTKRRRNKKRN